MPLPVVVDGNRDSRLTVLIGDPLVTNDGERADPDWRLPWELLADALFDALRRSGLAWTLDLLPATVDNAAWAIPRSRFVALLCHGDQNGVVFERDDLIGVEHPVFAADQIGAFFKAHPPDVVLALSCKSEETARAIRAAGVPLAIGIERTRNLMWHEALGLAGTFFTALSAQHPPADAVRVALEATTRPEQFKSWLPGKKAGALALPPPGEATRPRYDAWVSHPPREVFVGRERELAQLLVDVSRPGFAHLSGLPGVGKTELARALMDRCRFGRWPAGGSAWATLEGVTTPEAVLEAVRSACPPSPERERAATAQALGGVLGTAERLVVFDDAEDTLASPAAETLRACLLAALRAQPESRVRFVVTATRQWPWFSDPGVRRVVDRLGSDAAAKKLLEGILRGSFVQEHTRANQAWRDLERHADLGRLITSLEGHPARIVAAGQMLATGATVPEIIDHATDAERLLAALLDGLERARPGVSTLAALLAELPGGIPADTEMTTSERDDVALLRRHSVFESGTDVWRVAPVLGRYLREHAGPGTAERRARVQAAAARALVAFLEARVFKLRGLQGARALGEFEALRPTVDVLLDPARASEWWRAAGCKGRLAALSGEFALYQALPSYALRWTEGAEAAPDFEDDRAWVLLVRAGALAARHEWTAVSAAAQQALDLTRADEAAASGSLAPEQERVRRVRAWCGRALRQLGDANLFEAGGTRQSDASDLYRQALTAFQFADDTRGLGEIQYSLGVLAQRDGRLDDAALAYQKALDRQRQSDDLLGAGRTQRALGEVALRHDRAAEARRWQTEALKTMQALGALFDEAHVRLELGRTHAALGQTRQAQVSFEIARDVFGDVGERIGQGDACLECGVLALVDRDFASARTEFERARSLFEAVGDRRGLARADERRADLAVRSGDVGQALALARQAFAGAVAVGDEVCAAAARLVEARAHARNGDRAAANEAALGAYRRASGVRAADTQRAAVLFLADGLGRSEARLAAELRDLLAAPGAPASVKSRIDAALDRLRVLPGDDGARPTRRRRPSR